MDQAYGKRGYEDAIPPDSNLIFTIEVLNIIKRKKQGETGVSCTKFCKLSESYA